MTHLAGAGATDPLPTALRGMDAESINRTLELLVVPLQASLPQPTEVVLHDLRRIPNTVRAIAGDVTRRSIGHPPTDRLLERVAAGDFRHEIGYRSQLPDGRILQSTTIIYVDTSGHAAAALCLNADVSAWLSLRLSMDRFVLGHDETSIQPASTETVPATTAQARGSQASEFFPHSVDELSGRLLDAAITAVSVPVPQMRKEHKMQVVAELERRGFFLIRQSAETAAEALGVTRFTIYNYLNELNGQSEASA